MLVFCILCLTFIYDGIYYTTISDTEVRTGTEDTSYDGNAIVNILSDYSQTHYIIPEKVSNNSKEYTVTMLGCRSFRYIRWAKFSFPKTITVADDFSADVTYLPEWPDFPNLKIIHFLAFGSCSFSKVTLSDSIQEIHTAAFAYNIFLETIEVPKNCKLFYADLRGYLYNYALNRLIWVNNRLKHIDILPTVTAIEDHLLADSIAETVMIPPLCSEIGECAFIYGSIECIIITGNIKKIHKNWVKSSVNFSTIYYFGTKYVPEFENESKLNVIVSEQYNYDKCFGSFVTKNGNYPSYYLIRPTCPPVMQKCSRNVVMR